MHFINLVIDEREYNSLEAGSLTRDMRYLNYDDVEFSEEASLNLAQTLSNLLNV